MTYAYEDMIKDHLEGEKLAFWGSLLRGAGEFAYNAGRSMVPFLGVSEGAGLAGKAGYHAFQGTQAAKAAPSTFNMTSSQPAFRPQSTLKVSSLRETAVRRALVGAFVKHANEPGWHRAVNAASYAAFMLPYLSQRVHDNKPLATALNTAGLLGLGATSADQIRHGDALGAYDLAGLGLMGAGMIHNALRPDSSH